MALYTQAQLTALNDAIATGALEVWYGDKRVKYRDLAEMKQIRNEMLADLSQIKTRPRAQYPNYNSGI